MASANEAPGQTDWPLIYAIILNWNKFECTLACIKSCLQSDYPRIQVILVDNNSQDGSGEKLAREMPEITYLPNMRNDGFARGCNIGIRYALTRPDCALILLLNNDSELKRGALQSAVRRLQSSSEVGMVGGKILTGPSSGRIWTAGGYMNMRLGRAESRGVQADDLGQFDQPVKVTFVTAAMALMRASAIEQIGLIPDEYFFGQEEWDLSVKMDRAGYELWYEPEFVSYHPGAGSHSNADPVFIYNSYRNKLLFMNKYSTRLKWKLWFFAFSRIYARFLALNNLRKIHRSDSALSWELRYALQSAIRDYRRYGRRPIQENDLISFRNELDAVRLARMG
jgi:GT2 family glycosyltransferase